MWAWRCKVAKRFLESQEDVDAFVMEVAMMRDVAHHSTMLQSKDEEMKKGNGPTRPLEINHK